VISNINDGYTETTSQDMSQTSKIPWSSCDGVENVRIEIKTEIIGETGYTGGYTGVDASLSVENTLFTMMWKKCKTPNQGGDDYPEVNNQGWPSDNNPTNNSPPNNRNPPARNPPQDNNGLVPGTVPGGFGLGPGQYSPFSGALNPPANSPEPVPTITIEDGLIPWPTWNPRASKAKNTPKPKVTPS
jgi:hypothetical protein